MKGMGWMKISSAKIGLGNYQTGIGKPEGAAKPDGLKCVFGVEGEVLALKGRFWR
jgi:hypothetical protein